MARTAVAKRVYTYADGETGRSAKPGSRKLSFNFGDGTHVQDFSLKDFTKEVVECAAWHGFSQKLGDAFAGAKGDVEAAYEKFMETFEALKAGTWVAEGESAGPRVSLLAEAIARAKAKAGAKGADAEAETYAEKCKDKGYREKAANVPAVNAELEALKAERAAARAKKAAEAAKAESGNVATL